MADSILDALNEALDGPADAEDQDLGGEDTSEDSSQELSGAEDAEGQEESQEDAEEGAEDESEGESGEETAEEGAEGDPAAPKGQQPAAPKAKDPINDPIPKDLKTETRERMTSLVTAAKNLTKERDAAQGSYKELMGYIEETGATPQQYGDALNYLKLVNSGDPARMQQALTLMQGEVSALARMLGVAVPGVDMLSGHKDLQEAVEAGTLSAQHAEELAAARERTKVVQGQSQQRQQVQQRGQQYEEARTAGRAALNQLGEQLKAVDPVAFAAKHAILRETLQTAMAVADPSQWAAIYKDAFNKLRLPTAGAPAARQRTQVPANQPLRAKARAGGAAKAPDSMLGALNMALGVK